MGWELNLRNKNSRIFRISSGIDCNHLKVKISKFKFSRIIWDLKLPWIMAMTKICCFNKCKPFNLSKSRIVWLLLVKVKLYNWWHNILLASWGVLYAEVQEGLKLRCESLPLHLLWVCAKHRAHSLDSVQYILKLALMTYLAWLALLC